MNYSELFLAVKGFLQNDFPSVVFTDTADTGTSTYVSSDQIDQFIKLAEERIYNSVQLPVARKYATSALTANNKLLTLPADWLASYSIAVIEPVTNIQTFLLNKDVNFIRESFPDPDTADVPQYYAIYDSTTIMLGPTPDAAYNVEHNYFFYPESIVTAVNTWLGDNFESVLLYGALREGYVFLKGEADLMAAYEAKYQEALGQLKQLADGKNRQDMYRSGQVRVPVTS